MTDEAAKLSRHFKKVKAGSNVFETEGIHYNDVEWASTFDVSTDDMFMLWKAGRKRNIIDLGVIGRRRYTGFGESIS